MTRFVSLLLVPFFVLGQALSHSHEGVGEPDGHSGRAHIHLASSHHHEHDVDDHVHHHAEHQSDSDRSEFVTTLSGPLDHDSDAVYLAETDWTASRTAAVPQVDSTTLDWALLAPSVQHDTGIGYQTGQPPDRYAGLPIYLLTASLRL